MFDILELKETKVLRQGTLETTVSAILQDGDRTEHVSIDSLHPSYASVRAAIEDHSQGVITTEELAEKLARATNLIEQVAEKVTRVAGVLQGRMAIAGNTVTIDGDPIDPVLESHIIRLLQADGTPKDAANWRAFALFVDNLYSNVSEFVRTQLFGWMNYEALTGRGFTLTSDGCFIGYKGCAGTVEEPVSVHQGPAIVDGVPMNGSIPNKVGSVVEMRRSSVQDDPAVGCASGLHVGTYDYASSWARGVLLTVKVNPRDVVSVPTECNAQKIRTCRYEVLEVTEGPNNDLTYFGDDDEDDYGWDCDEEGDESCGICAEEGEYDEEVEGYDEEDEEHSDYVVSFRYRKADGSVKTYELEVFEDTLDALEGELTNGTGYRRFLKRNITDLTVVPRPEEEESETPAAETSQAPEQPSFASDKNEKEDAGPLARALAGLFGFAKSEEPEAEPEPEPEAEAPAEEEASPEDNLRAAIEELVQNAWKNFGQDPWGR